MTDIEQQVKAAVSDHIKALVDALQAQQQVIQNHERAIGVLLKEVKALKTAAEQKPKIWTP